MEGYTEYCSAKYKLNNGQMLSLFITVLRDWMCQNNILDDMQNQQQTITMKSLGKRLYFARYMSRQKKPCEAWETLKNNLCSLADLSVSELLQITVLDRFCSIIENSNTILCRKP